MNKCPECGSEKIIITAHKGECSCAECGFVIDDSIIENNEYIPKGRQDAIRTDLIPSVGGMPINGRIVKNSWIYSTREKNIKQANSTIRMASSKLRLPEIIEHEARSLFKRIVMEEINIGRDNTSLAYASIYVACNLHCIPKTPLEITINSGITIKKLMKSYRIIKKELGLKTSISDPLDFVPRFGTELGLEYPTISKASQIIEKLKNTQAICGKNPQTIVAAALYIAAKQNGEKLTQRQIANTIGVIEITIRKRARDILKEI